MYKAIHPSLIGKSFIYDETKENLELYFYSLKDDPEFKIIEISETDSLLEQIPEEFREKLSYMAYERGHACGQNEVNLILKELIYDLKNPIKAFEERIKNEMRGK